MLIMDFWKVKIRLYFQKSFWNWLFLSFLKKLITNEH